MKGDTFILSQIYVIITEKVNDMAKDKFAQWLQMNKATQAVADTSVNVETIIPTSPEEGKVIAIHAVDFLIGMCTNINASWAMVIIATRPDLGLADLVPGSPYVVAWAERQTRFTTSGMAIFDVHELQTFPVPFLVAHPKLYLYANSALTGEPQTVRARILFTFEKVSTEEYFQALAMFGS